jgi:hypothetical protein
MENLMQQAYEIRVINEGRTGALIQINHVSDHAAVRAGARLASGRDFEVWRGLSCIYGRAAEYAIG